MITYVDYRRLRADALDCPYFENFVAEVGGSVPACYVADDGDASRALELLGRIWALRDGSFRAVLDISGLSQTAFASAYGIPLRTVQYWIQHDGDPAARGTYQIGLLATDVINSLENNAE